jgi:hypothetical protein
VKRPTGRDDPRAGRSELIEQLARADDLRTVRAHAAREFRVGGHHAEPLRRLVSGDERRDVVVSGVRPAAPREPDLDPCGLGQAGGRWPVEHDEHVPVGRGGPVSELRDEPPRRGGTIPPPAIRAAAHHVVAVDDDQRFHAATAYHQFDVGELSEDELAFLQGVLDHAREGRTTELADAIERGVPVNLTGATGDSLLILAAYHDHPPAVRMLLERGADPNRVNDRGQTALGAAVFRRSTESVTALLEHGADPDAGGRSAVEIAAFFELDEMTALLARPRG